MIELRGVVAMRGAPPVSAVIRAGEVVRIEGDAAQVSALLEVIAGRRAARAGAVVWRRERSVVLLRAGDRLPSGVEAEASIGLLAELAGSKRAVARMGGDDEARAVARGAAIAPALWLVDGVLGEEAEGMVQRAAEEEVRSGSAAMVWSGGGERRGRVDRVIGIGGEGDQRGQGQGQGQGQRRVARTVARYAIAAATSRAAMGQAAIAAMWLALCAATVAAHESFWFAAGTRASTTFVVPLATAGIALGAALIAAVRAAAAPRWPAMLRDTGAHAGARLSAILAADAGGAVAATAVALVAPVWADGVGAVAAVCAVPLAAIVASAGARLVRGPLGVAVGALVGAAATAILLW